MLQIHIVPSYSTHLPVGSVFDTGIESARTGLA